MPHTYYSQFLRVRPDLLNDARLEASLEEMYVQMIALAEGSLDEATFADWLRARIVVTHGGQVQEKRAGYRR